MGTTAKIAEVMFDEALETYEKQDSMLDLVTFEEPAGSLMQNAGNFIWRTVEPHSPVIEGWDLTGEETDIIEESYPAILGTPKNDFVRQRADDLRDQSYWERRGRTSGKRLTAELNSAIASALTLQGSMFVRTNTTSGYTAVATPQAMMNERQLKTDDRSFILNDRDNLLYAQDLAGRQTLQGRPETVWSTGQVAQNVAGFNIYTASFLPNLTGGADPAATVTGNHSFAPEAGSVDPTTGDVSNVDYRVATLTISDSSSYNIGDKVQIKNSGTAVTALGLHDKTDTGQPMTFTVIAKPSSTSIKIYPKPIAADDSNLSSLEAAFANIDTQILNAATVNRVNIDSSNKVNLFFDKSAVEVLGGNIPANLFKQFDGMKVLSQTMKNGLTMYMVFDGNIATMNFRFRIFTWYGITIKNPSNCGVLVTY